MNETCSVRIDRINIRTTPEEKLVIQRAAKLSYKSVSAYILESAFKRAQKDIETIERLNLSESERETFFSILANPPEPNKALKNLFADNNKDFGN